MKFLLKSQQTKLPSKRCYVLPFGIAIKTDTVCGCANRGDASHVHQKACHKSLLLVPTIVAQHTPLNGFDLEKRPTFLNRQIIRAAEDAL